MGQHSRAELIYCCLCVIHRENGQPLNQTERKSKRDRETEKKERDREKNGHNAWCLAIFHFPIIHTITFNRKCRVIKTCGFFYERC